MSIEQKVHKASGGFTPDEKLLVLDAIKSIRNKGEKATKENILTETDGKMNKERTKLTISHLLRGEVLIKDDKNTKHPSYRLRKEN